MTPADYLIKAGDVVVICDQHNKATIIRAEPKVKVKLGRIFVALKPLIGCPFGSTFTVNVEGKTLERINPIVSDDWTIPEEDTVDNRNKNLQEQNTVVQQMTANDIAVMKDAGAHGTDIVNALASSSATFESKTEFSKMKYKKFKAQKHIVIITARRPTASSVATALFNRAPQKFGFVRPDSLGIILNLANIGAYARVLVMETHTGLISAAVAERLGGFGTVCTTYFGAKVPHMETLKHFNFSPEIKQSMHVVPFIQLLQARSENTTSEAAEEQTAAMAIDNTTTTNTSSTAPDWSIPFDCCIIASNIHQPKAVLDKLLPCLAPSSSFVVLHPWAQPLAECMQSFKSGRAVNMLLQEGWMRTHQVLPKRTHPLMNMNHGGAYIFSGTTVVQEE